ncbi:MAG: hypothetical protein FE835_19595 [Gammaproteobacteria bacterium]|nr:hypothetical protein [Gammaproteobacteria bacterium]
MAIWTEEDGTWTMDSFLSATPRPIVVNLNHDEVEETILKHRDAKVGISLSVVLFQVMQRR